MRIEIERARELVAAEVPFHHQGRDFKGIDCVGAIVYAYDYPIPLLPAYSRDPARNLLDQTLESIFGSPLQTAEVMRGGMCVRPIDPSLLEEADVVSMQYRGPSRHVGLIARHPQFNNEWSLIHTDMTVGRVTEHRLDELWLNRIVKVYRK